MARLSEIKNILKTHNLSVTDRRIDILDYMIRENRTISLKDLENEFDKFDRVTLYRTIKSFTKNGLIHKVPNDDGHATYGLCHNTCHPDEHAHDHIHFKCNECLTIVCLEHEIPKIEVPGYLVEEANLILKGTCKSCSA